MILEKGFSIKTSYSEKTYRLVGFWKSDCVFAPTWGDDEQCLIYSPEEVKKFLETGEFKAVE